MSENPRHEFYIGWAPTPPGLSRFVRRVVLASLVLALGLAATLVSGLARPPAASFAFGAPLPHRGVLKLLPAPLLWQRDGAVLYLVAPGKHGAAAMLAGLDGKEVTLSGSLIERPDLLGARRMLEIAPGTVRPDEVAAPGAAPAPRVLGPVRWRGEIVDGKCFLGVMVPGEGKTHRDCAARCLAGGTPPLLALADGRGGAAAVLLASADGAPLAPRLAPYVAEPVWIAGRLETYGDLLVLRVPADGVQRDR